MSDPLLPRRTLLKSALAALAAIPVVTAVGTAEAAPMPKVDINDPIAKSLGYAPDTSKVDDKVRATHKADQKCSNCVQFQAANSGCNLFPGKSVEANGWCTAWSKKP
jgi:hypothetical protein